MINTIRLWKNLVKKNRMTNEENQEYKYYIYVCPGNTMYFMDYDEAENYANNWGVEVKLNF